MANAATELPYEEFSDPGWNVTAAETWTDASSGSGCSSRARLSALHDRLGSGQAHTLEQQPALEQGAVRGAGVERSGQGSKQNRPGGV